MSVRVPSLSQQESEAGILVEKELIRVHSLGIKEQGPGSLFMCTWKRLQESTLLIFASFKNSVPA